MKTNEAMELGFQYTGMSCASWKQAEWENIKDRATQIKKTYKGADFRVVNSSCDGRFGKTYYKEIYGNEIFRKAQYFNPQLEEKYIDELHNEVLEKLKAEYEQKVKEEMDTYNKRLDTYNYMMNLRK